MNKPVIFYSGNTVLRPGNAAVIRGEWLDLVRGASISDGKTTESVVLYQHTRQSFKFIIPVSLEEGVFTLTLSGDFGEVKVQINAPVVRWTQCDEGAAATENGWVRVLGECLRVREDAAPYALIERDGKTVRIEPERVYDDYSVAFSVSSLGCGEYSLTYSNGLAQADPVPLIVRESPEAKWNKTVYNVLDYGFATDGIGDCTEAFTALLELVGKNGGGVVYIPRGRYHMTGSFVVPQNTVIRGDGYKRSQLFWTDEWFEMAEYEDGSLHWMPTKTPYYMFLISGNCAFENIDFEGRKLGNMFRTADDCRASNVRFDNIRVQANPLTGNEMHIRCGNDKFLARAETMREHFMCRNDLFTLSGENIKIRDCVFNWGGRPFGDNSGIKYFLLSGCVFGDCTAIDDWMPIGKLDGAIIEEIEDRHWTVGYSGRNVYFARSSILNVEDNNREAFTTDIAFGMKQYGTLEKIDGCRYTFPEEYDMSQAQPGKTLVILSGTGAGQIADVVSVEGNTVVTEAPFAVQPDETSVACVNTTFRNFYLIDLEIHNSGSLQFYTAEANTVVDRVRFTHSASIKAWGHYVYGTMGENWYTTMQNCVYDDVNYYHMDGWYMDPTLPGSSFMCAFGEGDETSNIGCVMRGNTFVDDSIVNLRGGNIMRSLSDCVIDGNTFTGARCAIYVEHFAERLFVHGNRYKEVGEIARFTEAESERSALFVDDNV